MKKELRNEMYWYLLLTIAFGSLAFFAVGVPYLYYFQILMPIYVLIATYVLFSRERLNKYIWFLAVILLVLGTMINLSYSLVQVYRWQHGRATVEANEYQEIAKYIRDNTGEGDKVFAYDYGATFYQLSQRKSGSRFISASVLLLNYRDHYGFGLDEIFMSEMDKFQTKYVVVYRDKEQMYFKNLPLTDYFRRSYHLEKSFEDYEVLRRN